MCIAKSAEEIKECKVISITNHKGGVGYGKW